MIRLLGEHPLTSPELTGDWERRLELIEQGEDSRPAFMNDIAKFTDGDGASELDKLKGVKIERANLGPCPVCGRDVIENRKGYSCWSKDDPGCGFVIWKKKAGKNLPAVGRQGADGEPAGSRRERGDEPPVGRTAKPVTGFKGRSGRTFRAKLKIEQTDEGKWRVDFDEEWAKEPPPGEDTGTPAGSTEAAAPEGAPNEDGAAPKGARAGRCLYALIVSAWRARSGSRRRSSARCRPRSQWCAPSSSSREACRP